MASAGITPIRCGENGASFVVVKPKGQLAVASKATLVLATDVPGEEKVRVPVEVLAAPQAP